MQFFCINSSNPFFRNARVAVIVQTPYQSKEFCDLHQLIPMGKFFVSINYAYYEIQLNEEEAQK